MNLSPRKRIQTLYYYYFKHTFLLKKFAEKWCLHLICYDAYYHNCELNYINMHIHIFINVGVRPELSSR